MMNDATTTEKALDIDRGGSRWAPPEGTTRHSGDPIEPSADFFVEPPAEIGDLVTAETTLSTKTRPWRTGSRLVLGGLIGWGAAMLLDLYSKQQQPAEPSLVLALEIALFLAFLSLTWYFTRFSHTCSFVGKQGLAKVRCKGARDRVGPPEVFRFEDATELRTSQTRHYTKGIYTGTAYAFIWTDAEGNKRFKLSGNYRGENALPKAKDPFHFAVLAEGAWSAFLFDRVVIELQTNQSARFNLDGGRFIAVGQGFLELFLSGSEPVHLTADEIGGMQAESGVIKIKRTDAKEGWFSSTGVYKFNYDKVANSRLFMLLYSRLIGK